MQDSTTGIEPYEWTIGNRMLDGDVNEANSARFAMTKVRPRHMWKIDADGELAHSATESITFSEAGTADKSKVSGKFYLGADYIEVKDNEAVDIADITTVDGTTVFIYAKPENGLENVLQTQINTSGKAVFSFSTEEPDVIVDSARNGRYDTTDNTKRAIGVLYKRTAGEYLLEIDLVTGTMTTPTYVSFSGTGYGLPYLVSNAGGDYGNYKFGGYTDAYYSIELSGAAGGNSGSAGSGMRGGNAGNRGALGTADVRGTNGITYGIGARGDDSLNTAFNDGGSGGGGGGGDSWVKGAGGYYIATGGNGGSGAVGQSSYGSEGGGGGYGGGGNKTGGAGSAGYLSGRNGGTGGRSSTLGDAYISAGSGGGGGGWRGKAGGAGGSTPNPDGGSLSGGSRGIGSGDSGVGYGGAGGNGGSFDTSTSLLPFVRFNNTSGSGGDGYLKVTEVITYTR